MTDTSSSPANLAILVDRFVAFLREQRKHPELSIPGPIPAELARMFDVFEHHLVALMLLAKSDDKIAASEREVILRHCAGLAQKAGLNMGEEEMAALSRFLHHYRPVDMQLTAALDRLHRESEENIASLIAAGHALVEADGVVRLQEALYLSALQRELHAP